MWRDAGGTELLSENATNDEGWGSVALPLDLAPPCQVYLSVPGAANGRTIAAVLPHQPASDIIVSVYARILVQTPSLQGGGHEELEYPALAHLWCVSWPTPQDLFEGQPDSALLAHAINMHSMRRIEPRVESTDRAIEYHDYAKRTPDADKSKLLCLREKVRPGSEHAFDIVFAGEVILSYYLPSFDSGLNVSVRAIPGEVTRVTLDALQPARIRIVVEDDSGEPVPDAHVAIVTRRDLKEGHYPDRAFFVFTPAGSSRRIAVNRRFLTTDERGEVALSVLGTSSHSELYASATKTGHVGAGANLWAGAGVPSTTVFRIQIKRVPPQYAFLTLGGRPLSDAKGIKVTDLEVTSVIGQVDYLPFSSDSDGRVRFEQLTVGHRYAVIVPHDTGPRNAKFVWRPGIAIELE
jgi:hypothetical protein